LRSTGSARPVEGDSRPAGLAQAADDGEAVSHMKLALHMEGSAYPILPDPTLSGPAQAANEGQVDPFVELALFDPATNSTDVLWSSHMVNEANPKWGEKFDFAMVSATSRLTLTVWDKLNFFEGRFSLKGLTGAGRRAPRDRARRRLSVVCEWLFV